MCTPMLPSPWGSLPPIDPSGKVVSAMLRPATLVLVGLASAAAIAHALRAPFPASGSNPVLDLIAYHDPALYAVIRVWYYAAPAVAVVLAGSLGLSVWRVWLQPRAGGGGRGHAVRSASVPAGHILGRAAPSHPWRIQLERRLALPSSDLRRDGSAPSCPARRCSCDTCGTWPARDSRMSAFSGERRGDSRPPQRGSPVRAGGDRHRAGRAGLNGRAPRALRCPLPTVRACQAPVILDECPVRDERGSGYDSGARNPDGFRTRPRRRACVLTRVEESPRLVAARRAR